MPRPRGFDETHVIDRAMELFWTKGYEATSVSDITAELGVHPGSLYRTFCDKHALFLRALGRYRDTQARALAPALLAGGPVLLRIRAVMIGFIELAARQEQPRGCLAANTVGAAAGRRGCGARRGRRVLGCRGRVLAGPAHGRAPGGDR